MLTQTQGQIYLANQRGCTQSNWYRSFHTFNCKSYFKESRKPFNNLLSLNDITLKAEHCIKQEATENIAVCLIPLVGNLKFKQPNEAYKLLEVGESVVFSVNKGDLYEVECPYKRSLINYLQIEIKVSETINYNQSQFDFNSQMNQLLSLLKTDNHCFNISIGKFNGRVEGEHLVKNPENGLFAFVIEGAFEVQDRLLQIRDGLALWEVEQINFEALSNDAIILILDVGKV
ncbi:MAG: pirin [Thalassobius sp.]|nr:pirin [Thalassovita sp.]